MKRSEQQITVTLGRLAALAGAYGVDLDVVADRIGAFARELGEFTMVTVPSAFDRLAIATSITVDALDRVAAASPDPEQGRRLAVISRTNTRDVYVELETTPGEAFAMTVQAFGARDLEFDLRQLVGFGISPAAVQRLRELAEILGSSASGISDRVSSTGEHSCQLHISQLNADDLSRDLVRSRVDRVAGALGVTGPQRRVVEKLHDALAQDRPSHTWLRVVPGSDEPILGLLWTDVPWDLAIRMMTGFYPSRDAGTRLGELSGALEANVASAVELVLGATEPPEMRVSGTLLRGELLA